MNIRAPFITNTQPAKLMQPGKGTFNDPAGFAQATAVEDLSYRKWKNDLAENEEIETLRGELESIIAILDDTERSVVEMVMQNRSHKEIAEQLHLQNGKVRKILFYAKEKLQKAYKLKSQDCWRN